MKNISSKAVTGWSGQHILNGASRNEGTERAWQSLGKVFVGPTEAERPSIAFWRSLYIVKDLKAGDMLTKENVRAIRPGHGLPVKELDRILGRKATRDLERGTPLAENDIA